jgi:hypothetical protein
VEIAFNIAYLIIIWALVFAMIRSRKNVDPADKRIVDRFLAMFFLLALGDTGHVGFRVIAYARGGLQANPLLVGLGALATAITVTFFYMIVLDVWRIRFGKRFGAFGILLFLAGVVRLVVMALPGNDWGSVVPPEPMGIIRNLFLMLQGLGVMFLILRDSIQAKEKAFLWVGICILISYLFYIPVILFVKTIPVLGMLMIPKTLAYVAIAVIVYRVYFLPVKR